MKNEKSPGPDGLPVEFYKCFFHLFGNIFVDMINEIFESAVKLPSNNEVELYNALVQATGAGTPFNQLATYIFIKRRL
jgi:hypothetical protein